MVKCPTRPSAHFNIKIPSDCKAGSRRFSIFTYCENNIRVVSSEVIILNNLSPLTYFSFKRERLQSRNQAILNHPVCKGKKHFFIIKCFHPPKSFIINLDAFDDFGTMYVHFNKKHSSSQETKPYLTSVFRWQETTFKNMNNTKLQYITLSHPQYSLHAEM